MSERSTTPDLVELGSRFLEAANRSDLDAALSFFAPDAVWEMTVLGVTLEGVAAIRDFLQDWFASYEELWFEQEGALDLGNGVVFSVLTQKARLVGSSGEVRQRSGAVVVWVEGLVVRATFYTDINEARAAAERLAEERQAVPDESTTPDVPPNAIEIIREFIESTSFDEWAQRCAQLSAPDAVVVFDDSDATGLGPFEGLAAWVAWVKDYWAVWDEHHHYADEILDLGNGVLFFVVREDGRMMGSDAYVENRSAWVSLWVAGLVVRTTVYLDIDKARAAAERLAQKRG